MRCDNKYLFCNENSECCLHRFFLTKKMFLVKLKVIVHPKMKRLSSFTDPRVVPNLYDLDIINNVGSQTVLEPIG